MSYPGKGNQKAPYALILDEKSSGTDGGSFTSGDWKTRDLTVKPVDEIGVTLSSNQFTLPPGKYLIESSAPGKGGLIRHQARLYNVTEDEVTASGTSELVVNTGNHITTRSFISEQVEVTVDTVFEIQHRCQQTVATNGFGLNIGSSFTVDAEVYTVVEIWKQA